MQIFLILAAAMIFLLIYGTPVLLLIYGLVIVKKTGIFPWKKILIGLAVMILGILVLTGVSSVILNFIQESMGISGELNFDLRE